MALPLWGLRRFRYARYFGDGVYPTVPKYFVLTDRVTGQLYRVVSVDSAPVLVAISGPTNADIKEDFMVVRNLVTKGWKNLYVANGVLLAEETKDNTRAALVPQGGKVFALAFRKWGIMFRATGGFRTPDPAFRSCGILGI